MLFRYSFCSFHRTIAKVATKKMPLKSTAPKRPPPTHFLCLPLLTPTSTPQLKITIAHLKSAIEASGSRPQTAGTAANPAVEKCQPQHEPLVPAAAFRPLGTLHLTLGVMSLKDPEVLQGALKLLQELDLEAILREVSNGQCRSDQMATEKLTKVGDVQVSEDKPRSEKLSSRITGQTQQTVGAFDSDQLSIEEAPVSTLASRTSPPRPTPSSNQFHPHSHSHPQTRLYLPSHHSPQPLLISLHSLRSFPPPPRTTPQSCTPHPMIQPRACTHSASESSAPSNALATSFPTHPRETETVTATTTATKAMVMVGLERVRGS